MIASKMVHLIEKHSDELAETLTNKLHRSERTAGYLRVPHQELLRAVRDVYRNLGEWLQSKTEADIEVYWVEIGRRRCEQNVPLNDFAQGIIMSKENLWAFLRRESMADHVWELLGEIEFLQLLDGFFDRALYFAITGYEEARRLRPVAAA